MVEGLFHRVNPVDGWDIHALSGAAGSSRVAVVFRWAAGLLLKAWKPAGGESLSGVIIKWPRPLFCLLVVVLPAGESPGSSLSPFWPGIWPALVR